MPIEGNGFLVMLKAGTITLKTNQAIPITPRDDRVYLDGSVGGLCNQP